MKSLVNTGDFGIFYEPFLCFFNRDFSRNFKGYFIFNVGTGRDLYLWSDLYLQFGVFESFYRLTHAAKFG
jgi:hypothetical protein